MLSVMIVDDMDFSRKEIKRLKIWGEKSGFHIVEEAKNGSEALIKLETCEVDLVITDIKMPKVDGIELLGRIMEKNLCSCVVLLSDYSDFDYARQGLVLGAFDYLRKPADEVEFEKLLERVKEFILRKRKELDRVKKLEERLEEKVEIFFPRAEVNQIIEHLGNGNLSTAETAGHMVHIIKTNLNSDLIKVESVLRNVVLEVTKAVSEKYGWLDKFINIKQLESMDFLHCDSLESLEKEFIQIIDRIASMINMLNCNNNSNEIVSQVCSKVLMNIDGVVSLSIISDIMHMNKTYISETFKQKTGIGFIEYLRSVKMERAKRLINEGNLKIYEVGEKLGYMDIEYFSRQFKKYSGYTPIEYRQNNVKKEK